MRESPARLLLLQRPLQILLLLPLHITRYLRHAQVNSSTVTCTPSLAFTTTFLPTAIGLSDVALQVSWSILTLPFSELGTTSFSTTPVMPPRDVATVVSGGAGGANFWYIFIVTYVTR